ncbi:MAG: dihydrolipoyl dehydrogenase [Erysipelotrichaceae bacterium]|nr:dihydrolipoyl dehydrogenase [Erysipelotrichaceae bacterium]
MNYDVAIIGGGPGGYTAANKAAASGLKTILFERNKLGGTCLNRGCIPMKSLISSAETFKKMKEAEIYGIHCSSIGYVYADILKRKNEVTDTLREGIQKSLQKNKVEIVFGEAKLLNAHHVSCEGNEYEAENIILATGSVVAKPPIEGIEFCITSDDILEGNHPLPESLVIIGGGVIGVEIADALSSLGCKITIIEMFDHLLPNLDKELGQRLAMFFKKKEIEVICSAQVRKISSEDQMKQVTYTDKKGEEQCISARQVLIVTGRKANVSLLEDAGLEINRGIVADENGRTNIPNIYVIGDARSGNIQLAHVAEAQGENVVDLLLGKEPSHDPSVIPSGIYTEPEIAAVGISEQQAKDAGISYATRKYLTGANGKSLIENSESGFVKLIVDENETIIGGQLVCMHATELIAELAIAVQKKMTISQFAEVVHPHPTISEMLWDVAK